MAKINLEFLVDIEGDDADLKKVKSKLLETHSSLEAAITGAIQEKISQIGINKAITVKLPPTRITLRSVLDGGLNAQEWLEKENFPEIPDKEGIKKEGFQD